MNRKKRGKGVPSNIDKLLDNHRRKFIAAGLVSGRQRKHIARDLKVTRGTLYRWIESDTLLAKAVNDAAKALYEDTIDEIRKIAFADVETTSTTKLSALKLIKDSYESTLFEATKNLSMDDARRVMAKIIAALDGHPQAKRAVIDAFDGERRRLVFADGGSGAVPEDDFGEGADGA